MAIKTMSASTGGGSKYSEGWHEAKIEKAEYNEWNDKKYLEVWFEDYGQYNTMRVYEMIGKEDNQEFAMSRVFKYAQAGIISVLDDPTGKRPIIQYDDSTDGLIGKTIFIYVHPDPKNDKYTRILNECAPLPGEYEHMSYTEDASNGIKASVVKRYKAYMQKRMANNVSVSTSDTSDLSTDVPF